MLGTSVLKLFQRRFTSQIGKSNFCSVKEYLLFVFIISLVFPFPFFLPFYPLLSKCHYPPLSATPSSPKPHSLLYNFLMLPCEQADIGKEALQGSTTFIQRIKFQLVLRRCQKVHRGPKFHLCAGRML